MVEKESKKTDIITNSITAAHRETGYSEEIRKRHRKQSLDSRLRNINTEDRNVTYKTRTVLNIGAGKVLERNNET